MRYFAILSLATLITACSANYDPAEQVAKYERKAAAAQLDCWAGSPGACDEARDAQAVADYYRSRV